MAKTRQRIQKTVRVLPAINALIREIAAVEADYRFLTEAEAYQEVIQIGALVLAAQVYGSGRTLDTITEAAVLGELRMRLLPVLEQLAAHGMLPTRAGAAPPPAAPAPVEPAPPAPAAPQIDATAASVVQSFGAAFLRDDDA